MHTSTPESLETSSICPPRLALQGGLEDQLGMSCSFERLSVLRRTDEVCHGTVVGSSTC